MADKNINQLPEVTAMGVTDLFVLEQAGAAKKLTGQLLKASLMAWLDGHGGVKSFAYDEDTGKVTIVTTDGTTLTTGDLRGKNGHMIHAYDLGAPGSPGDYLIMSFSLVNPMPEDWAVGDLILNSYGDMWVISKITPTDNGYNVRFDFVMSVVGPQGDSPTIGSNGHWWVGDTDTGVVARGDTGTHGSDVTVTSAAVPGTDEHPNGGVKLTITETVYDATGAVSQVNTIEKTIWNGNTGPTGPQGTAPHIGDNGHWYVGAADTGVNAKGDKGDGLKIDGSVPTYADLPTLTAADMGKTYLVDADGRLYFWSGTAWPASGSGLLIKGEDGITPNIGANGHWWIGTTDTGVQAKGEQGKTGPQGPQGPQGETGPQGPQGPKGDGIEITGAKGKYLGFTDTDTLGAVDLPNASTGSKGITYLVDSYERTDTDKAVTPKALNNVYKLVKDKADKSAPVTATLLAANWTGDSAPYSYTLSVVGVTASSNQEFLPALDITTEQLEALQGANIQDDGQAGGTVTLKAFGTKPTIDLPIRIIKRGDA
nr:MAG TPA: nucleoid-associated protein [Caudoviricetes sp.]